MSAAAVSSAQAVVTTSTVRGYPPGVRALFAGDPSAWLPGELTMHGATTFHLRGRLLLSTVTFEYVVGSPWTSGPTIGRRLRVGVVDQTGGRVVPASVTDGELSLTGDDHLVLRFRGAVARGAFTSVRRVVARQELRRITAGIAARLSRDAPPTPPSKV